LRIFRASKRGASLYESGKALLRHWKREAAEYQSLIFTKARWRNLLDSKTARQNNGRWRRYIPNRALKNGD